MNDKQLAFVLKQYQRQLNDIYNELCQELSSIGELEYHQVKDKWIGEGKC